MAASSTPSASASRSIVFLFRTIEARLAMRPTRLPKKSEKPLATRTPAPVATTGSVSSSWAPFDDDVSPSPCASRTTAGSSTIVLVERLPFPSPVAVCPGRESVVVDGEPSRPLPAPDSSVAPQAAVTTNRTTMNTQNHVCFDRRLTGTSQRVGGPERAPTVLYPDVGLHYLRNRCGPGAGSRSGMTEIRVGKSK